MSDLDDLMNADPLGLSDQDVDGIIAYQRRHRAMVESGVKPKKEKGPAVSLDGLVTGIIGLGPKADAKVTRR